MHHEGAVITRTVDRVRVRDAPGTSNQQVVNLRMRAPRGPRFGSHARAPTAQDDPQKRSPAVEVATENDGQLRTENVESPSDVAILQQRTVREV